MQCNSQTSHTVHVTYTCIGKINTVGSQAVGLLKDGHRATAGRAWIASRGKNGNFWYKFAPKGVFIATKQNSTQLKSTRQREQQLTRFVGRDVINKKTTDLAVRCSTGSVELCRYKHPLRENFWGSIEELEYGCTTTNLPLCNDTVIIFENYTAS